MSLVVNPAYNELAKAVGPYAATMYMAEEAKHSCNILSHRITTAVALNYAANGRIPDPKDFPDHRLDRVKEYITYIDDIEIKSAVIVSYEESLKNHDLIYCYNTIQDAPRRTRIRIIMNILWDNRPHKKD